jgi:pimeloyl-ACP methyl ester carboxylesterase
MEMPETRYARSGSVNIAYQVVGEGAVDLLWIPGFAQHVELSWEDPFRRRWLEALASEYRLIVFDKRGTGLSDRVVGAPLEVRMDDCRAVLDAAASSRAAILTAGDGSDLALFFAATYRSGCLRWRSGAGTTGAHGRPTSRGLRRERRLSAPSTRWSGAGRPRW